MLRFAQRLYCVVIFFSGIKLTPIVFTRERPFIIIIFRFPMLLHSSSSHFEIIHIQCCQRQLHYFISIVHLTLNESDSSKQKKNKLFSTQILAYICAYSRIHTNICKQISFSTHCINNRQNTISMIMNEFKTKICFNVQQKCVNK